MFASIIPRPLLIAGVHKIGARAGNPSSAIGGRSNPSPNTQIFRAFRASPLLSAARRISLHWLVLLLLLQGGTIAKKLTSITILLTPLSQPSTTLEAGEAPAEGVGEHCHVFPTKSKRNLDSMGYYSLNSIW